MEATPYLIYANCVTRRWRKAGVFAYADETAPVSLVPHEKKENERRLKMGLLESLNGQPFCANQLYMLLDVVVHIQARILSYKFTGAEKPRRKTVFVLIGKVLPLNIPDIMICMYWVWDTRYIIVFHGLRRVSVLIEPGMRKNSYLIKYISF